MNAFTRAHKSLCILLILSMFFMGCSSVNQKSGSFSDSMQSTSLSLSSSEKFSDETEKTGNVAETFVAVLLVISLVGLIVLLADSDTKEDRRQRRHHRGHRHSFHSHYDCSCY